MSKVLIAGIGNVLLGDDGVGPFAIKVLESQYEFPDTVELADLGTPTLDLPMYLSQADALILVDSASFAGEAGAIRRFRKSEILRSAPRARVDTHSPALVESLALAELIGKLPREVLMIGVQGTRFDPGCPLSSPVRNCMPHIVDAVRRELYRLGVWCEPKTNVKPLGAWWDSVPPGTVGAALLKW